MIIVNFPAGITEVTIPALNQWDYGQKIAIHGLNLPQITEVHFCDKTCDKALVRLANKILDDVAANSSHSEVAIPDALLENPHAIHAFVFVKSYESAPGVTASTEGTFYTKAGDEYTAVKLPGAYAEGETYYRECGKVTYKINIPVIARTQPDGYPCEDESVQNFLDEAMARINDASAVIEKQAHKSAKIYNIKDGLYYDTWIGSKAEYEALTDEQKAAIHTLFIYDNQLTEGLASGEIVVAEAEHAANADSATSAETAKKTSFTTAEWKDLRLGEHIFVEGNTYQVYFTYATVGYTFTFTVPTDYAYQVIVYNYDYSAHNGIYIIVYLEDCVTQVIQDENGNKLSEYKVWKMKGSVTPGPDAEKESLDDNGEHLRYRQIR